MGQNSVNERVIDRVVILFLFALFLLLSPLVDWWAADDSSWFAPFLVWGLIILLGFLLQRRIRRHAL